MLGKGNMHEQKEKCMFDFEQIPKTFQTMLFVNEIKWTELKNTILLQLLQTKPKYPLKHVSRPYISSVALFFLDLEKETFSPCQFCILSAFFFLDRFFNTLTMHA